MSHEEQPELGQPDTGLVPIRRLSANGVEPHPELEPREPAAVEVALPLTEPTPEKNPFWGYNDLLLFVGLAPVCLLLGYALVKFPLNLLHIHPSTEVAEALPEQLLGYLFLFGALALIFRQVYDRPFWASLGWTPTRLPFGAIVSS